MAKKKDAATLATPLQSDLIASKHRLNRLRRIQAKLDEGQELTSAEIRDYQKYEREVADKFGFKYATHCSKQIYHEQTGTVSKVVLEQAERLGLPWEKHSKTVNLFAVLRRFHAIIAENPVAFYKALHGDKTTTLGTLGPAHDFEAKFWEERFYAARDERLLREKTLVHADSISAVMGRIADHLRNFGERLGKQFGEDAQAFFLECLDECEQDINSVVGLGDNDRNGTG